MAPRTNFINPGGCNPPNQVFLPRQLSQPGRLQPRLPEPSLSTWGSRHPEPSFQTQATFSTLKATPPKSEFLNPGGCSSLKQVSQPGGPRLKCVSQFGECSSPKQVSQSGELCPLFSKQIFQPLGVGMAYRSKFLNTGRRGSPDQDSQLTRLPKSFRKVFFNRKL